MEEICDYVSPEELADWNAREDRYMADARRVPEIRKWHEMRLQGLALHLWCMCREELAAATVDSMRERKKLLHGYITDDEIAEKIDEARARKFFPLPDSRPFMGAASNWHGEPLARATTKGGPQDG